MMASVFRDKVGQAHYWLGLLLVFWLPLDNSYIPFLSLLWLLTGTLALSRRSFHHPNVKWSYVLLFVFFYLLHMASVLYSSNKGAAWFDLEIKMPLLLFPFFTALVIAENYEQRKRSFLLAFIAGNFVAMLFCLANAIWGHAEFDYSHFLYRHLAYFQHPSYFALYLGFSMAALLFYFLPESKNRPFRLILILLLTLTMFVFIVMLSSRAGMLAVLFVPILKLVEVLSKLRLNMFLKTGVVLLAVALMVLAVSSNKRVQRAVDSFSFDSELSQSVASADELSSSETRMLVWNSSWEIIRENMFIGIGNGDVKHEITAVANEKFDENKGFPKKYNAHNQYLDTFVALGLPGIIVLLIILLWPAFVAVKNKDWLLISMVILLLIHLFFESMVNRQAGVVFLTFFLPLLFARKNQ